MLALFTWISRAFQRVLSEGSWRNEAPQRSLKQAAGRLSQPRPKRGQLLHLGQADFIITTMPERSSLGKPVIPSFPLWMNLSPWRPDFFSTQTRNSSWITGMRFLFTDRCPSSSREIRRPLSDCIASPSGDSPFLDGLVSGHIAASSVSSFCGALALSSFTWKAALFPFDDFGPRRVSCDCFTLPKTEWFGKIGHVRVERVLDSGKLMLQPL